MSSRHAPLPRPVIAPMFVTKPPLMSPAVSSEKTFRRVLAVSAFDGWSVVIVAGLCTVSSLVFFSWAGVLIGAPLTAAGIVELRGRSRLLRGQASGLGLLINAQLLILTLLVVYSVWNLLHYNEAALLARIPAHLHNQLSQAGLRIEDLRPMLKPGYFAVYLAVIAVSVLFQGGLALYYHSRKAAALSAMDSHRDEAAPPPLPA